MMPSLLISIIITTRNRAPALRQTLDAFGKVRIASHWLAELIVVDNASTDDTKDVVGNAKFSNLHLAYLYEPQRGQNNALNAGLRRARGTIILFTDDDVSVSENWVEEMVATFQQSDADAVVGKVVLADNLQRPWFTEIHKAWLAVPDNQTDPPPCLIGANMGLRRPVLERVPAFDPELGPGGLGFDGEGLFGRQMAEAGFKMKYAPKAVVVHWPGESRLTRAEWLKTARNKGRSLAYIRYHWEHEDLRAPRLRWLWYTLKLHLRRILQPPPPLDSEGCPPWEISYIIRIAIYGQFCVDRRRQRNYSLRGLKIHTV